MSREEGPLPDDSADPVHPARVLVQVEGLAVEEHGELGLGAVDSSSARHFHSMNKRSASAILIGWLRGYLFQYKGTTQDNITADSKKIS